MPGDAEAAPQIARRAGGWTLAGLASALLGPLAMMAPPMQRFYASAGTESGAIFLGQSMLWIVLAVALACHVFGDRLALADVGLVFPRLRSIALGLAIGASVYVGLYAIALALMHYGMFDAREAAGLVNKWPFWLRLFALLTAGIVEEALYRGFAIERLTALTGRRWLAGLLALAGFVAAHLPFWGLSAVATPIIGGGFFTLVYLWRRDLIACMVAHIAVDAVGLIVAPALGIHP